MPRSVNHVASKARRKKLLKKAKGYWGARSKVLTVAKHHVEKGLVHAYRDRKLKKRNYRSLWIIRINAAAREHGISYSKLIHALDDKGVLINRKLLANLAVENPQAFADVVKFAMN
ncbi:MAG: 50S ribosomal protein L20 [Melioribacteraceae bacterium]|jgi:large subunit ribosomal protein L20|nr:50S ribosomal protein L20 [Melioribacteraceae bacterium]